MGHRGPDSNGVISLPGRRSAVLGAVRLRIIDVSPLADQPMCNSDQSVCVAFNGELYNFAELRSELQAAGHTFLSRSDTECLVHLYEELRGDMPAVLTRLRGMFAFAIWDRGAERLSIARDRLGIKPVYWAETSAGVHFSSEVRALTAALPRAAEVDATSVHRYLEWGVVPGPTTIVKGVHRLPPGHLLTWTGGSPKLERWWSPEFLPDATLETPDDAARMLRSVLFDSVARHLVADRPVGVFLSSGTDSQVVASAAAPHGTVRALTVGYPETPAADEVDSAQRFAQGLGLDHVTVPIVGSALAAQVERVLKGMDQPTSDGVNTWILCEAAREAGLVVALSGVGGDELFGGYRTFSIAPRVARVNALLRVVPSWARRLTAQAVMSRRPGHPLARALSAGPGLASAYAATRQVFSPGEMGRGPAGRIGKLEHRAIPSNRNDAITVLELRHYLADQLLPDTDTMSMAHSVEVRVPLLDDAFVGAALRLPPHHRSNRKTILALAAGFDRPRPKQPFTLPFDRWMRGPLRPVVQEALLSAELPLFDVLDSAQLAAVWSAFNAGKVHWSKPWALTVLRLWPQVNGYSF